MEDAVSRLKSGLSKTVTQINLKTSSFLEVNKIKTYIQTLNDDIKALKSLIGETAYSQWTETEINIESLAEICVQIKEKENLISEQERAIDELNYHAQAVLGEQSTPGIGNNPQFICPNCGMVYSLEINFCTKCGNKMK